MLFILEIVFTVKAWKHGWKAWALAPWGALLGFGFLVGLADVDGGMGVASFSRSTYLLLDLALVAVLFLMSRVARSTSATSALPVIGGPDVAPAVSRPALEN